MSGLAACIRHNRPRTRPVSKPTAKCRTDLGSARMAPACLMAPGPGLTFPRLNGIPVNHRLWCGEQAAARAAAAFLRAGIAAPEDWDVAQRNPIDFLKCSLDRWAAAHGAAEIGEEFRLTLSLSTLDQHSPAYSPIDQQPDLYLIVEPESAGYVVLGPTLRLLEQVHPRLPVTFAHLFLGALNRWVRVYDWRDALDRVDRLREWYDMDMHEGVPAMELPDIKKDIPSYMDRKPLSKAALQRLTRSIRGSAAGGLMDSVLELERASARVAPPVLDAETGEKLVDCGEPLPALLVVFEKHDHIEGQFDEESEGMLELTPEPNLIVYLGTADEAAVQRGFDALATGCQTLSRAVRLIKLIASIDPSEFTLPTS